MPREMRSISFSGKRGANTLHVEAPGCVVNIHKGLHDTKGRAVTAIHINADSYSGETAWRMLDLDFAQHAAVRVVEGAEKPTEFDRWNKIIMGDKTAPAAMLKKKTQRKAIERKAGRVIRETDEIKEALAAVCQHQTEFWEALATLEGLTGLDLDGTRDYSGLAVADLEDQ